MLLDKMPLPISSDPQKDIAHAASQTLSILVSDSRDVAAVTACSDIVLHPIPDCPPVDQLDTANERTFTIIRRRSRSLEVKPKKGKRKAKDPTEKLNRGICGVCSQFKPLAGQIVTGALACASCFRYYSKSQPARKFNHGGDRMLRRMQAQADAALSDDSLSADSDEEPVHKRFTRNRVSLSKKAKVNKRDLSNEPDPKRMRLSDSFDAADDSDSAPSVVDQSLFDIFSSLSEWSSSEEESSDTDAEPDQYDPRNPSVLIHRAPGSLLNPNDGKVDSIQSSTVLTDDAIRYGPLRPLIKKLPQTDPDATINAAETISAVVDNALSIEAHVIRFTDHDEDVTSSDEEQDDVQTTLVPALDCWSRDAFPVFKTRDRRGSSSSLSSILTSLAPSTCSSSVNLKLHREEELRAMLRDAPRIKLEYPAHGAVEDFILLERRTWAPLDPFEDIITSIIVVLDHYLTEDEALTYFRYVQTTARRRSAYHFKGDFVRAIRRAVREGCTSSFIRLVEHYNSIVRHFRKQGLFRRRTSEMQGMHEKLWTKITNQAYERTVGPRVEELRRYTPFSDTVYGEMLPRFMNLICDLTDLGPNQVFVDLGSGVGNCVAQAVLATGCQAFGIELQQAAAAIAQQQLREVEKRCRMWGITSGNWQAQQGDFFKDVWIREKLRIADVVLVNNYAFSSKTNHGLLELFLELPDDTQVVSLKPFVPFRKDGRLSDERRLGLEAILQQGKRHRFGPDCVSWMPGGGEFFIGRIDRKKVKDWQKMSASRSNPLDDLSTSLSSLSESSQSPAPNKHSIN